MLAAAPPDGLERHGELPRINIAQRDRFAIGLVQEQLKIPPDAMRTDTDKPHRDPLAGRRARLVSQRSGGDDVR
jgi:hypothetical protein